MRNLDRSSRPEVQDEPRKAVAYVMNGFPRMSETFIAHEIHQLERLGMTLRLFSVKRENEPARHPVIDAIRSPLVYLPKASSLSGTSLPMWLWRNAGRFAGSLARGASRHPLRFAGVLHDALALSWAHRQRDADGRVRLRKVFIKEFLQASEIAARVLRAGDVGHLHGHFCHGVATITWFASRLAGIPFSFTAHAKDIYQADLNPGDLLERKMGAARFVVTCTCANAAVLKARHPRPADVHAIYPGLDMDWFSARATRADEAGSPRSHAPSPLILSVGRLVEKKGFDQLVDACALLRDRGLRFRCAIVGERGSAFESIVARIDAHRLGDSVRLVDAVTQDALRALYPQAAVFALPCQVMADGDRDGFPNVLAEAMAMGVPIVSTHVSGIPEMVDDGVHGLLVPARDPQRLATALARVLENPALARALAGAARARICERFDSRQTTVALLDLFRSALARQRGDESITRSGRTGTLDGNAASGASS